MYALAFLSGAIVLQVAAATMALRLVRATGRRAAWILITIALALMALRRAIPLARAIAGDASLPPDPLNELVGLVLSGCMAAGVGLIGPIFQHIFRFERELRDSERKFRSYFDLPLVGVAIVSPEGRWVTVNDRLCEILGRSREELRAAGMDDCAYPEDVARERPLRKEVDARRTDGYSMDKRFAGKDGSLAWVSQAIRVVRDPSGAPSYYIVVLQDISDRKAAEEALRRSASESETLLRELHHRTKNNMQMICSMLNLEATRADDERITESFRAMSDRIVSMSLVHEMLLASRDPSSIDLAEYVLELCALLKQGYFAASDKIRFQIELRSLRVPLSSAIPLGLILNELVTNSLKHAFPAGRRGTIDISARNGPDGAIELTVADDGVGVPAGFDLHAGSGVGCRTVATLAEQIGASVKVERDGGFACRVSFRPDAEAAIAAGEARKTISA